MTGDWPTVASVLAQSDAAARRAKDVAVAVTDQGTAQ